MVFASAFTLSHSNLKFCLSTPKPTLITNDMINVFAKRVPELSVSSICAHYQCQSSQPDSHLETYGDFICSSHVESSSSSSDLDTLSSVNCSLSQTESREKYMNLEYEALTSLSAPRGLQPLMSRFAQEQSLEFIEVRCVINGKTEHVQYKSESDFVRLILELLQGRKEGVKSENMTKVTKVKNKNFYAVAARVPGIRSGIFKSWFVYQYDSMTRSSHCT